MSFSFSKEQSEAGSAVITRIFTADAFSNGFNPNHGKIKAEVFIRFLFSVSSVSGTTSKLLLDGRAVITDLGPQSDMANTYPCNAADPLAGVRSSFL